MKGKSSKKGIKLGLPIIVIVVTFVIAQLAYNFIFGDPSHFMGNSNENQPLPGDYFGIVYKGGPIVPILMTINMVLLTFVVERLLPLCG